jgi:hypothetical protein
MLRRLSAPAQPLALGAARGLRAGCCALADESSSTRVVKKLSLFAGLFAFQGA